MITLCPAAALPSPPPASGCTSHQRVSAYDNLSGSAGDLEPEDEDESDDDDADEMSDDGTVTEFSEPWDSTRWDRLLSSPSGSRRSGRRINSSLSSTAGHTETPTSSEETTGGAGSAGSDGSRPPTPPTHSADHQRQMKPPIPPHHQSCSVISLVYRLNNQIYAIFLTRQRHLSTIFQICGMCGLNSSVFFQFTEF